MRWSALPIVLGLVACSRPPAAVPPEAARHEQPEPEPCEVGWMASWAEAHGLQAGSCHGVDLAEEGGREILMRACSEDGHQAVVLVDRPDGRWAIEHDGWGHVPVCDEPASLMFADTGPGDHALRRIEFHEGRPILAYEEWSTIREPPLRITEQWDYLDGRLHRELAASSICAPTKPCSTPKSGDG